MNDSALGHCQSAPIESLYMVNVSQFICVSYWMDNVVRILAAGYGSAPPV